MKNNKSLGQHWLKNRQILDCIADLAYGYSDSLSHQKSQLEASLCLEIGPGLGTLTSSLLRRFKEVIAVEFDERLATNLPKSFPGKNLTVVHQDFLKFDLATIPSPYVVAGNIPYYITSPIISKLLQTTNRPERIVLLIQKEVAERIAAEPGHHTVLSLQTQNYATVMLGPVVPHAEFTPPPEVDSQIIILEPRPEPLISPDIFRLIKQGFSSPRKKLMKNLPASTAELTEIFARIGLDSSVRPANLSLNDWKSLAKNLH